MEASSLSAVANARWEVLRGGFNTDATTTIPWKNPSEKLLVHISSTITDTTYERDYLVDDLQFQLRERSKEHGIEVIFFDFRFGITDQITLDHKTWEESSKAIEWCKLESMGLAFLSLQGNKYGYCPLPRVVLESDLLSHLSKCECSEDDQRLIFEWYHLDLNADPKTYVLRNLKAFDDPYYWSAYDNILRILTGLPFDTLKHEGLRVGQSATESELRAALDSYPCQLNRNRDICWSFRNFSGNIDDKFFCDFAGDKVTENKENKWTDLIAHMKDSIPSKSIKEYSMGLTLDDMVNNTQSYVQYLDEFRDFVTSRFEMSLTSIIETQKQWYEDGNGVGIPGEKLFEMLHHCNFAKEKCVTFIGQNDVICSTLDAIKKDNRRIEECVDDPFIRRFHGVCVSIIGVSGSGKTALISKVACEFYSQMPEGSAVIVRFCGTTRGSNNAFNLMLSICAQIEFLFDLKKPHRSDLFPSGLTATDVTESLWPSSIRTS